MKLYDLRTEYRVNPVGLSNRRLRFSWKLDSAEKNTMQTSYKINVIDENGNQVWNSGTRISQDSVLISYDGEKLESGTCYTVLVSVTDNYGNTAEIEGTFETGIFDNTQFSAQMITSDFPAEETACPVFERIPTGEKSKKSPSLCDSTWSI